MTTALLSVYDKTGVTDLAAGLGAGYDRTVVHRDALVLLR